MTDMNSLLAYVVLGNTVQVWLSAFITFIVVYVVLRIAVALALRALSLLMAKSASRLDDDVAAFLRSVPSWVWIVVALLIALRLPVLPELFHFIVEGLLLGLIVVLAILLIQRVLSTLLLEHVPRLRGSEVADLPAVLRISLALVLWAIGFLLILSNLGINVISLVAGLGIGGIAVALAVQNILGDIFSSYSLYFDQPFKEGDFIIVGEHMGTVKKIGLKTTRLKALQGEEIIISNQELTSTRVQNYKRMFERRIAFRFGVTYDTPLPLLRDIPQRVKEIVESHEGIRFDRAHFFQFGASSLDFEVVYIMQSPEYGAYMDAQQAINLALMEDFAAKGIEFAFPTQTVHIASQPQKAS